MGTKFKVGDKIKFVGIVPKKYIGKIGVIDVVRHPDRVYPYTIKFDGGNGRYPVRELEIEKVTTKRE